MVDFAPSTSDVATVVVAEPAPLVVQTQLSISAPSDAVASQAFDVTGDLVRMDTGEGIASALVQLQKRGDDGSFADFGLPVMTADDGTYDVTVTEAAAGSFDYQTVYAGGSA